MSDIFEHGYALIVGVDANQIPRLALPAVAKDVQAVYDVLVHPDRCAYNPDNVKFLSVIKMLGEGLKLTVRQLADHLPETVGVVTKIATAVATATIR